MFQQIIAQAPTPAPTTAPTGPAPNPFLQFLTSPLFPLVLVLVAMWIFTTRSKRSQEKQRQAMLDNLKRGDRVQTIGGIIGNVIEARDTEVVLKVDESSNTKIRFSRAAIHRVLEEEKPQQK